MSATTAPTLYVPADATSATCLECDTTFRNELSLAVDVDDHRALWGHWVFSYQTAEGEEVS